MTATLLALAVAMFAADAERPRPGLRKRPPAESKPRELTREEEEKLDAIVNRVILADIGRLSKPEARKALKTFDALGAEAIPAMIRGLNKAAKSNHTCPVLVISKKLGRLLDASRDPKMLEFARDEIGADIGRSRYAGTLQGLRVKAMLRKNALARLRPTGPPRTKTPRSMTTAALVKEASTVRGPRLKMVLTELGRRKEKEALSGLVVAAGSYDRDTQKLGRELLDKSLARHSAAVVKGKLADDSPVMRSAAVRVIAARHPRLAGELITLLDDDKPAVRLEAHRALVRLSKGEDFGPSSSAGKDQRKQAQRKWRAWWERQGK
jgi:hypothetical protein